MKDEEIYQQIEEYSEEASAFYERSHEQVETSIVKHAQTKKRRKKFFTGILSVATVIIVTLAVVLPIVIQPQEREIRYNNLDELVQEALDCNLKEYCLTHNQKLLYLDWYEYAEDLETSRYYEEGKESETVYLYETFFDGNIGYSVEISIMKRNIVVESLDDRFEAYQTMNINNCQITYTLNRDWSLAKFEYKGYKYYLKINDSIQLDFLVETIESMFNN